MLCGSGPFPPKQLGGFADPPSSASWLPKRRRRDCRVPNGNTAPWVSRCMGAHWQNALRGWGSQGWGRAGTNSRPLRFKWGWDVYDALDKLWWRGRVGGWTQVEGGRTESESHGSVWGKWLEGEICGKRSGWPPISHIGVFPRDTEGYGIRAKLKSQRRGAATGPSTVDLERIILPGRGLDKALLRIAAKYD